MYRTNAARQLTFAVPAQGATAILPQQAAAGTVAKIKQTGPGYFNIVVQAVGGGSELRFGILRWNEVQRKWVLTMPGLRRYQVVESFQSDRQRDALAFAVRYVTEEWVTEVGNVA